MILIQNNLRHTSSSLRVVCVSAKQWRSNTLWATKRKPKTSIDLALDYFDSVYSPLFGKKWPSIRLALLSPHKYCAVVNYYGDNDEIRTQLENEGAINIREMFEVHKNALLEKNKTVNRKNELEKIYNLEKKLTQIAERQRDEEVGALYPEGVERPSSDIFSSKPSAKNEQDLEQEKLIQQAKNPLRVSLSEANIDRNRQIDASEGLNSSRLNEFVPVSKIKGKEDFVSEAEHFSFYNDTDDFPITVEAEESLYFPPHLDIYTFVQGNISTFTPTKTGLTGVSGYYLMDAASIMPVLALGLTKDDVVLDMCAAPGGKSLVCLQTLYPELVVCNDSSLSRLNRLKYVMTQYITDWEKKVKVTNLPADCIADENMFSKILVDVPCTNDRHSVMEDDNNIFKPSRNKERILLPHLQVELLFHALKLVKKGGTVVYSTCSLNPGQNDGVVNMALRKVWEETSIKIVVKDLTKALEPSKIVFQYADLQSLKYGSLIIPYLPSNFGPMYFCKLQRIN